MSTTVTSGAPGPSVSKGVQPNYGKLFAEEKKEFVMDIERLLDKYNEPMWGHLKANKTNRYSIKELSKPDNYTDWERGECASGRDRWSLVVSVTGKAMENLMKKHGGSNEDVAWDHLSQDLRESGLDFRTVRDDRRDKMDQDSEQPEQPEQPEEQPTEEDWSQDKPSQGSTEGKVGVGADSDHVVGRGAQLSQSLSDLRHSIARRLHKRR